MIKRIWCAVLLLVGLAASGQSLAVASCSFLDVNGTLNDFGIYVSGQANDNDSVGSVRLQCNDDALGALSVSVMVGVDGGQTGNVQNRALSNGIDNFHYALYDDITRSNLLGDGSGTTIRKGAVCLNNVPCDVLVYGRAFGGQYLSMGNYVDDVIVTVEF